MSWPGEGVVPLPERVRRLPRPATRRLRPLPGHLSGSLTVAYRVDQPVYVGVGEPGPDGLLAARVDGRTVIPGGALRREARARFEAITLACSAGPRPERITTGPHAGWTITPGERPDAFVRCDAQAPRPALCPACALFGAPGLRGRVWVGDFFASEVETTLRPLAEPEIEAPAPGEGVVFDEATQTVQVTPWPGRRFAGGATASRPESTRWVETIPRGTVLVGVISVDGVTPAELGGLLSAFGLAPGTFVKVGWGRGVGFGRLRPANVDWHLLDEEGASVAPNPAGWRAAHVGGPDYWRAGEVALVRLHTRGDW